MNKGVKTSEPQVIHILHFRKCFQMAPQGSYQNLVFENTDFPPPPRTLIIIKLFGFSETMGKINFILFTFPKLSIIGPEVCLLTICIPP